ncbi:DUF1534 domain-containing protein [Pseudomonas congelans]|nr:DUF1534 domain-containing protein [Pseudomonas congelans]
MRHRCEPRCPLKIRRGASSAALPRGASIAIIDTTNKNAPSKSGRF